MVGERRRGKTKSPPPLPPLTPTFPHPQQSLRRKKMRAMSARNLSFDDNSTTSTPLPGADFDLDDNDEVPTAMSETEVFGGFLRELYDHDNFLFFLHARAVTQAMFGLKLAALRTRLLTGRGAGRQAFGSNANSQSAGREAETGGGGLLRTSGEVLLTPHGRFSDGTLEVNLSRPALEKAAQVGGRVGGLLGGGG